jgi:hypothetical protein
MGIGSYSGWVCDFLPKNSKPLEGIGSLPGALLFPSNGEGIDQAPMGRILARIPTQVLPLNKRRGSAFRKRWENGDFDVRRLAALANRLPRCYPDSFTGAPIEKAREKCFSPDDRTDAVGVGIGLSVKQ